jgi:hypothetical protein
MASINNGTAATPPNLAADLLEGAEEIAEFWFGDRSRKSVRKVYYLASEIERTNRPPIVRLGKSKLIGRRSRMLQWLAEQEEAATTI